MNEVAMPSPPESARFAEALVSLGARLPELHRSLLVAHFNAPDHTASARDLAMAIGLDDWQEVNLHYGRLGTMLREALDYHAEGQQSAVIASFVAPDTMGNKEWLWVMHAELAQALVQLGCVAEKSCLSNE